MLRETRRPPTAEEIEAQTDALCLQYLWALEAGDARLARRLRTTATPRGRAACLGVLDELIEDRRPLP